MIDAFEGKELSKKVDDQGFVALIDMMPRIINEESVNSIGVESAIVQMARISYGLGIKTKKQDEALVKYLMRHNHWSPFEAITIKFHLKLPIFIARQLMRHRTFSFNEISQRYTKIDESFYVPSEIRLQSHTNKQVSNGKHPNSEELSFRIEEFYDDAYTEYNHLLIKETPREQARMVLPLGTYTELYMVGNLRNILHFIELRIGYDAQKEIQLYARAIKDILYQFFPISFDTFMCHKVNGLNLSENDMNCDLDKMSLSEKREFVNKMEKIREMIKKWEDIANK